jgi:hypothetical protein
MSTAYMQEHMLPEVYMVATRDLAENTVLVRYQDHDVPSWEDRPVPLTLPLSITSFINDPTSHASDLMLEALANS